MLLLDTHVWVWAVTGDTRQLGPRTRRLVARAESAETVRVSVVSVFELTALHTLGRIRLTRPPGEWIREATGLPGVRLAELSAVMAIDAGSIPREALADPIDRLLVATAGRIDVTLVTADERILEYATRRDEIRTHDARV